MARLSGRPWLTKRRPALVARRPSSVTLRQVASMKSCHALSCLEQSASRNVGTSALASRTIWSWTILAVSRKSLSCSARARMMWHAYSPCD